MDKPQLISHLEKSLQYTIFDTRWIPCSAKFVVLGSMPRGTGKVQIYEINSGNLELIKEFEKKSAFKCGTFGASSLRDRNLATGDFAGKLQVWDLEDPDIAVFSEEAHHDIINCMDGIGGTTVNCGAPELVTGSRDGAVKVWDLRQKGAPVALMEPSRDDLRRDCWTVAFGDSHNQEERCVCAGYDNGDVKMFDLRKMKVRWETNVRNGVCGIEFDRRDIPMNKLVCGTLEGGIHCWDLRTLHPEKGFACVSERGAGGGYGASAGGPASRATVWLCRHLPQNRELFASCGGAGSIRIWKYNYPDRRSKDGPDGAPQGVAGNLELIQSTVLSTQPVCAFDWSPDRIGLAVCGAFDQTLRVLIATKLNLL